MDKKISNTEPTVSQKKDAILRALEGTKGWCVLSEDIGVMVLSELKQVLIERDDLLKSLVIGGYVRKVLTKNGEESGLLNAFTITVKGSELLEKGGFSNVKKEKSELERLAKEKLIIDISNAENAFKSYPTTKIIAWISLGISGALLILKIAEQLGWLPLRK